MRTNAFVSGPWLKRVAPSTIGTKKTGRVHLCDVYATLAGIAGVDPTDHRAAAAGLPPVDSLDMMPYWTGKSSESPRRSIHHDPNALSVGDLKILTGKMVAACWSGNKYPNASGYLSVGLSVGKSSAASWPGGYQTSWVDPACNTTVECGDRGCLFSAQPSR